MPYDTLLLRLTDYRIARELRPMIAGHDFRLASFRDDPIKFPNDPLARQRRVGYEALSFPSAYIDDSQDLEPATISQ